MIDRFLGKSKEQLRVHSLPPLVLRLFGEVDYEGQLNQILPSYQAVTRLLMTNDVPQEALDFTQRNYWQVIQSKNIGENEARENASLLLNEAIHFMREEGKEYIFLLSSGYQRHLDIFYDFYTRIQKKFPDKDAYYFVLPETHPELSIESYKGANPENGIAFLVRNFPYETALIMNINRLPDFEDQISKKGALGQTENRVPLGGMEFFLTLLSHYAKCKKQRTIWSPSMVGIHVPIVLRSGFEEKFLVATGEVPPDFHYPDNEGSLEVTPSDIKISRRIATFKAAMEKLQLTDNDISLLFSNTSFTNFIAQ